MSNIGASTNNINILNGKRSVVTRDASFGGNKYTSLLQKELGLTFDQAERVKRGMPLPEGVESRETAPILDTVSDILALDRKSTRLNSSHQIISYAVFCLKKKKIRHY